MQTVIKNPNWWRRRTTLERCLTLVSIFAIIAVIGLVIGLVAVLLSNQIVTELDSSSEPAQALHGTNQRPTQNEVGHPADKDPSKPSGKQDNVCLTPECIHTASLALKRLKPEVEPCDDFYQFACGTFLEEETIPEDKVAITTFSTIQDRLQLQLRDLVATKPAETELNHFKLPYALYKACMNQTLIEKLHTTPIKKFSDMFGGWPLLVGESWDADNTWSWQEATKNFRKHGFSMDLIVDFSISVDYRNTTRRMIDIDQSSIGLSREYLVKGFNETLVSAYFDYMVDLSVLFGAEKQQALKELRESMEFEIALANISWPNEKRRNSSELYNKRTVKQVQAAYPYVDWLDYINALLGEGLSITEDEEINVSVPSFFEELGKLLAKTPKRTVANYMMFRLHAYSVSFLSEPFRKRQLQYSTALSGRQEQEARWKECVDIASGSLGIAVGSLYVRKHFKEDSKAIALEMVDNIRAVYNDILSEVEWMDEKTRVEAKEKLRRMTTHIGYPDEMLDNNKLADYYAKLEIDSDNYFESILRMNVFGTNKAFGKFRLPVNKTEWTRHARPAIVNAFYASIENSIQFPAGILQGYFFNAQRPKYMNYGAIGYVIGHEMTHGFDDQGRQFDVDGNLRDWWQPDTQAHYLEKAKCIIEQYGNYTDKTTGLNLNGVNTQGENIADNGGVKESYIAYRRWAEKNGPEPTLPGLDYTPEQMFWISAAQTWCSKFRKESLKMRITTGAHSPGEFRVIGPFGNMKDFSKDFQCPEGSTMNPVHKCIVW